MLVLVDPNDSRAVRNKDMILDHYARMINGKDAETGTRNFVDGYIQHNPLAASGRAGVVKYFTEVRKVKPTPIPEKLKTPIVAVLAEGDLVIVAYPLKLADPKNPSLKYTTTWFDMWRIKDGKADEHWDAAKRE